MLRVFDGMRGSKTLARSSLASSSPRPPLASTSFFAELSMGITSSPVARDLGKAARHPVVEERPVGRHRERTDIRSLGRSGGTEFFGATICHPLSQARIRDVIENPLNLLKAAWTAKVSRFDSMLQAAETGLKLLPVPLSTLGGWHPGAYRALCPCRNYNYGKGTVHILPR